MKYPNFFILGAPRCGTTSLCDYLRTNPRVFVSRPKEIHFFAEDFSTSRMEQRLAKTEDEYVDFFKEATPFHIAAGEGAVLYLSSKVAVEKIRKFNPESKIIVLIRNHVDFVASWHACLVYNCVEPITDLKDAWNAIEKRRTEQPLPPLRNNPKFLLYSDIAKFGEQLERVYSIFPRNQIKVILNEDFSAAPECIYREVLEFLNVPADARTEFPRINRNKINRYPRLATFFSALPPAVVWAMRMIKTLTGLKRFGIAPWVRRHNRIFVKRKPLDPLFRKELIDFFREDRNKLSRLLNRDLTHWKNETTT